MLSKEELELLLKTHGTAKAVAVHLNIHRLTIQSWCKKLGISLSRKNPHGIGNAKCSLCHEIKTIDNFYSENKEKTQFSRICKPCYSQYNMKRWKDRKEKAIEYKGGKCLDCGLSFIPEVYQFHHRDPNSKDYDWRKLRLRTEETIRKELDKCDLLCANCHCVRHVRMHNELKSGLTENRTQVDSLKVS